MNHSELKTISNDALSEIVKRKREKMLKEERERITRLRALENGICPDCGSESLEGTSGRFGKKYHFHCLSCGRNNSLPDYWYGE